MTTTLEPPKTIINGATVIFFTEQHPGGNGFRPHGIALCYYPVTSEFVTWRVYLDTDINLWYAESGSYFKDLYPATVNYLERGGKSVADGGVVITKDGDVVHS